MNNKSITPSVKQPVKRVASGQLPSALAELSEAALAGADVMPSAIWDLGMCSFEGDE
jgi:bacteriocin leader peptide (microcyclamide/patellamide family)